MQKMGRISIVSDASLTLSLRAQYEQTLMSSKKFIKKSLSRLPLLNVNGPLLEGLILRAHSHQASASMLRQLCDDASDSVLIEISGDI